VAGILDGIRRAGRREPAGGGSVERRQFDEVVAFAIEKEQEAVDAYIAASKIVKRAHVGAMLREFAAQEEGHKRKLLGIDMAGVKDADVPDIPDLKIADFSDDTQVTEDMDYQDVLSVAMKREESAHNLYTMLASNTTDQGLRKLFELLASEEAKHKLALEKEYDENVLSEN
jgi:rubrerythrin